MKISPSLKALVKKRARGCCEYCWAQAEFSPDSFVIEHINPLSKGGSSKENNLAYSCQGCNNHKYNHTHAKDLVTGELTRFYNPRQDLWTDHFLWNEDFSEMIGISPTGRVTIACLDLNRAGVKNLRMALYLISLHPPWFTEKLNG